MALGTLWAQLALDTRLFRKGLGDASSLSMKFSQKISQDLRQAYFSALSPQRWLQGTVRAVGQAMREIETQTSKAQTAQAKSGDVDIPLGSMTKLVTLSERLGVALADLVGLWRENSAEAKTFRDEVEQMSGGEGTGALGDLMRGLESVQRVFTDWLIGMTSNKFVKGAVTGSPLVSTLLNSIRSLVFIGAAEREQDQAIRSLLLKRSLATKAAASAESRFTLARPEQGSLAAIGGFTAGAGILARTHAKTQSELLKVIAANTKVLADLARAEATVGGAP